MRIGYAKASTQDQNLNLQKDVLKRAGCEKIMADMASGKNEAQAGLEKLREIVRKGDMIVVWRLDRLGRSLRHLIDVMTELEQPKCNNSFDRAAFQTAHASHLGSVGQLLKQHFGFLEVSGVEAFGKPVVDFG